MKRSSRGKRISDLSPPSEAPQDPFDLCARLTDDFALLRDALVAWYSASPSRLEIVAQRDFRFFDVATVAIVGHALTAEAAFIRWAQIEVASGAQLETLQDLSEIDQWEPPVLADFAVDDAFRGFLRESRTIIPDVPTVLLHFASILANRIISGKVHACEGARTLSEIQKRLAREKTLPLHHCPSDDFGLQRFCFAAQNLIPPTFEVVGCGELLHVCIRKAAEDWLQQFSNLIMTTDDPSQWPTNWRSKGPAMDRK